MWYDEGGMWRLGDRSDAGSDIGRASVESISETPAGPHLKPWMVYVWSGKGDGGEWVEQPDATAQVIQRPPPKLMWIKPSHQLVLDSRTHVCNAYACYDDAGRGAEVQVVLYTSVRSV